MVFKAKTRAEAEKVRCSAPNNPSERKALTRELLSLLLIVIAAVAGLLFAAAVAARAEAPAVSAKFLYGLGGMDVDERFNQPRDVFADPHTGEIYVADSLNDRIRIFNDSGMPLFEFGSMETLRRPRQVVVDSQGNIYALHSESGNGVISIFNFRGKHIGRLSFDDVPMDEPVIQPKRLAIDRQDNLYVLDDQYTIKRIFVFNADGEFLKSFRIMTDLDEKLTKETFAGKFCVAPDGTLFIPNPVIGMVYVYSPKGEFLRYIGRKGGGSPGTLNFPVDVAVDGYGRVVVLDKTVSAVILYDRQGTYLGQFGGMGKSYGWFIWPNSIDLDAEGRVYVAQVPGNRVQVLQLRKPLPSYTRKLSGKMTKKGSEARRSDSVVGDRTPQ